MKMKVTCSSLLVLVLCIGGSPLAIAQSPQTTIDESIALPLTVGATLHGVNSTIGGLIAAPVLRQWVENSGSLDAVMVSSAGGSTPTVTVYGYDAAPSSGACPADGGTFAETAADVLKRVGFPFALTLAGSQGATATGAELAQLNRSIRNHDSPPTTNLYFCLVSGSSFTPAANDFSLKLSIFRNGQ